MASNQSLVWRIHQELSRTQRHTHQVQGTHDLTAMVDNRLYGLVGDSTMVGTLDSLWYCRHRDDSSGEDKDVQTNDLVACLLQEGKIMKYLEKILHSGVLLAAVIGFLDLSAIWAAEPVNTDTQGLAIQGYDPVAYFIQGRPFKGTEAFAYRWMGAEWRFVNAEHLDLFRSSPEKYAPQYGGY